MDNDKDKTHTYVPISNGTLIRQYEIIKKIGSGGMGEVFLARDTALKRKIAIKFLLPFLCQDEVCRQRFKREAQAAAGLNHPNIISIHEVNEYKTRPYFVMDFIEGQSLKDYLENQKFDIDRIQDIALQLCDALEFAHNNGVIHRDIKPLNIVLDSYGRPLILDFGLATVKGSERLTKSGSTMGTVRYMSPEQIKGKDIDHRSDLFSLGVVFYEMITGHCPFDHEHYMAVGLSILNDTPEPLEDYRKNIPEGLKHIVFKLLEKDCSLRYQTSADIIRDLKRTHPLSSGNLSIISPRSTSRLMKWGSIVILVAIFLLYRAIFPPEDEDMKSDQRKMLAVLPFENLGEPDMEYFSDGITEEIISKLAAINGLGVISRTSVQTYKKTEKSLPQIARELGVGYILEGTIRWDKSGETDRVRITSKLIQVTDDVSLWAENYERPLKQIFSLQSEIATQIVNKLGITLEASEDKRINSNPTDNIEAFNLFLKGTYFLGKQTVEGFRKGKAYYDKALAIDSNFALAWAGLSVYHTFILMSGSISVEETYPSALYAADKAIELDSLLIEAHIAKGWVHSHMEWDWNSAEREFKRAIELGPSSAFAHVAYATFLLPMNRNEEAIVEMQKALELDPVSPFVNQVYGWAYYISGNPDKAIIQFHKTLELDPLHIWARTQLAWTYAYKEMFNEAAAQCDTVLNVFKPEFDPWLLSSLGVVYAWMGQKEPAHQTLLTLLDISKDAYIDPFNFACLYSALDEKELALTWLKKAFEMHSINVFELLNSKNRFFLKNISKDTRYWELIERFRNEDNIKKYKI